ncbi:DNA topoisomerase type IA zn finger domain protein [Desulfamplus magnetovallimortis]|uniref:DNA topoisomerase type IA zn finger domain protein n=2 Tax=Desulfamplus magnetovallimortis TaxID=1246637 RepID=A0A1W1HCN0_9BACT|nr:DNA topoisomerase type IA zn finger domain protein [Desulfamplus magnetovallimortis]
MDKIILEENELNPTFVRTQLDEILAREIISLIEIDSESALLTYNLSTISAILVAVERDREIKNAKGFPPERYTIDSLTDELEEIGLTHDDTLNDSLKIILDQGYLTKNSHGEIKAEVSAYTIVGFLDRMFPGMQGIQLVAFVLQMADEVLSKRKSLDDAKESFAQTLKNSGVSVTREKAEKKAQEIASKQSDGQMREMALKLKEANIKRLAQQRFREKMQMNRDGGKPSFHFDGGSRLDRVKITSVFDNGPSKEELDAIKKAEEEKKLQEEQIRVAALAEKEKKLKEAEAAAMELEKKAAELAAREQELENARLAAIKIEQAEAELKAKQAEIAMKEAELKLKEEQIRAEAEEKARLLDEKLRLQQQKEEEEEEKLRLEQEKKAQEALIDRANEISSPAPDDIEARIAAFESELATPCPVCHTGKVKTETTDAGKRYYVCSDSSCRFVSWSQPYHFSCPLCKNPFLVDFQINPVEKGLKCPRASCSFSQKDLGDPALKIPNQSASTVSNESHDAASSPAPKKKRLVRRVKRRR